jgi:hypothetical protein
MLQIICIAISVLTIFMGIKAILSPSGIQLTQSRRLTGDSARIAGVLIVVLGVILLALSVWGIGWYMRNPR